MLCYQVHMLVHAHGRGLWHVAAEDVYADAAVALQASFQIQDSF